MRARTQAAAAAAAVVTAGAAGLALFVPGALLDRPSGQCPDVDVAFARGSGEPVGLGSVGAALASALPVPCP